MDTARSLARDLVDERGYLPAIGFMLGYVWQAVKLLLAVVLL